MPSFAPRAVPMALLGFAMVASTVHADGRIAVRTSGDWSVEVVSDDLDYPWDLSMADGKILVTEAKGTIVTIDLGRPARHAVMTSDPIANEGGGGLLGSAPAPDFSTSGKVFLYHSYRDGPDLRNKVIEAKFDGARWGETRVLVDRIPGHRLYNGGRIAIGPDGHLYVTTGWTEDPSLPQDLKSLAGKVLRMTLDGQVPDGNPFDGSLVYSYGHRNPQGLAWNAQGQLHVAEHGQSAHDEINVVRAGGNYGWPVASGDDARQGMTPPAIGSGDETWAPSGIAFAGDELLVAALGSRGLLAADGTSGTLIKVFASGDRLRDVLPVGDTIYVVTTNRSPRGQGPSPDRLLKLFAKPSGSTGAR